MKNFLDFVGSFNWGGQLIKLKRDLDPKWDTVTIDISGQAPGPASRNYARKTGKKVKISRVDYDNGTMELHVRRQG